MQVPFDNFADTITLNFKNQLKYKTYTGFIFTIIFLLAVLAVFIQSLVSMLKRENPTSNTTEMYVDDPELANIINVPLAFTITPTDGNLLQYLIPDYHFRIKAYNEEWVYFQDPTTGMNNMMAVSTPVTIRRCQESDFVGSEEVLALAKQLVNVQGFFCIPRNQTADLFNIKGKIGAVGYKYLKVELEKCNGTGCANDTQLEQALASVSVVFAYGNSFVDINNFNKPIQPSVGGVYDTMNIDYWRAKFVELTPIEVVTDEGFIWSQTAKQLGFLFEAADTIFDNPRGNARFSFYIRLSNQKKIIHRQYKKIQDVLAQTTGISSTLALVFFIILQPYIKIKKSEEMINEVLMKSKDNKIQISFLDFVKSLVGNKQAKAKMELFKKHKLEIEKRTDILNMIKNNINIEKVMQVAFDEDQKILLNNLSSFSGEGEKDANKVAIQKVFPIGDSKVMKAFKAISSKPNKDRIDRALLEHYKQFETSDLDLENPNILSFDSSLPISPAGEEKSLRKPSQFLLNRNNMTPKDNNSIDFESTIPNSPVADEKSLIKPSQFQNKNNVNPKDNSNSD